MYIIYIILVRKKMCIPIDVIPLFLKKSLQVPQYCCDVFQRIGPLCVVKSKTLTMSLLITIDFVWEKSLFCGHDEKMRHTETRHELRIVL